MRHPGIGEQIVSINGYRADGTIASNSAPQLILPNAAPRSSVLLQNASDTVMYFEFGSARASATITNGVVTSCTVLNAGFGFTYAPLVQFVGGGSNGNGRNLGVGYPSQISPSNTATAQCVMTSDGYGAGKSKVSSITITNGGANYATAPYVRLINDPNDAFGCADPSLSSGTGLVLYPGQSIYEAHSVVTTDPVSVWCSATGKKFFCRYTT